MSQKSPFSLYVHIPFCIQKCPYCDFNTYAVSTIPEQDYITALIAELDFYAARNEWRGRPIQTIYFGGGTPSLIAPEQYERFFSYLKERFPVVDSIEITFEANPSSLDREKLEGYVANGMNRLSLGSQSFQPKILERLGRLHSPEDIERSVELARAAEVPNVSLDLIFGIPEQTKELFLEDIQAALKLKPEHVSAYSLTYEKGTPFFQARAKGLLKVVSDDDVASMMEQLIETLRDAGYEHYEVSNFSLPDQQSRHNMAYWNRSDYLGLGAGAHSYFREAPSRARRWSNMALPAEYMDHCCSLGQAASWHDVLELQDLMFEFFFLGMRRSDGVRLSDFQDEFGESVEDRFQQKINDLAQEGLIEEKENSVRFTSKGLLLGDSILEHFVL